MAESWFDTPEGAAFAREQAEGDARWNRRKRPIVIAMGVPAHLADACDITRDSRDEPWRPDHFTVTSSTSATPDEVAALGRLGFDLSIHGGSGLDLRALGHGIEEFTRISGWSDGATGFEALQRAHRLELLMVDGEPVDVDLSMLTALRRVGDSAFLTAGAHNRRVVEVDDGMSVIPADFTATAPLESVVLRVPRKWRDISFLRDTSRLRRLELRGPVTFDLSSLADCPALEELEIIECRELLGVETLLTLPKLRGVRFEGIKSMPGAEALARGLSFHLGMWPNHVFDRSAQARIRESAKPGGTLIVETYRPAHRKPVKPDTVAVFLDGEDVVSFDPFRLIDLEGDGFQLLFDDWDGLADILDGPDGDGAEPDVELGESLVLAALGALPAGAEFDSDGSDLMLMLPDLLTAEATARALARAFRSTPTLRRLRRSL